MLDVVIDRKRWARGIRLDTEGNRIFNRLLSSKDDKMCCLGFACKAAGLGDDVIENFGMVGTVIDYLNNMSSESEKKKMEIKGKLNKLYIYSLCQTRNTPIHDNLVKANDSSNEEEIESKVIELGKKANLNFSFVG